MCLIPPTPPRTSSPACCSLLLWNASFCLSPREHTSTFKAAYLPLPPPLPFLRKLLLPRTRKSDVDWSEVCAPLYLCTPQTSWDRAEFGPPQSPNGPTAPNYRPNCMSPAWKLRPVLGLLLSQSVLLWELLHSWDLTPLGGGLEPWGRTGWTIRPAEVDSI